MNKDPLKWLAPAGIQVPPSDPEPKLLLASHKPLTDTPMDWRSEMQYALNQLGEPILTAVDAEGYPVPFRVRKDVLHAEGVNLDLPPVMPAEARGRACLTFHSLQVRNSEMYSNENLTFTGTVYCNGGRALFKMEHQLPSMNFKRGLRDMLSLGSQMLRMKKRLEIEAARRGQPVPVIRLSKQ